MKSLIFLLGVCVAEIHIWEPPRLKSLYSAKDLDYTITNFGVVPYGHSLYGTLFKASPFEACQPLSGLEWDRNQGTMIMLVTRGGCHFAEKVLNAQRAGAGLVIIGDNTSEDIHKIMAVEKSKELLNNIKIPSILISKQDSDTLKGVLDSSQEEKSIVMAINFPLVKSSQVSRLKIIAQIDDFKSYEILSSISNYYPHFQKTMDFRVNYKMYNGIQYSPLAGNCLSSTESFCVVPDSEPAQEHLMNETARHLCTFEASKEEYLSMVKRIRNKCFEENGKILPKFAECSQNSFESSVDNKVKEKVKECMTASSSSNLFSANYNSIRFNLINYSPLIFINGYLYKGNYMDASSLMEAFCNSFEIAPKSCDSLEGFAEYKNFSSFGLIKFVLLSVIVTLAIIITVVGTFYYLMKRKIKRNFGNELNSKINEALSKYYNDQGGDYKGIHRSEEA